MTNNSVTKLPRSTLAKMTGGDNQAIKALENMEFQTLSLPEQVAYLQTALAMAQNDIIYSTRLANEALDQVQAATKIHSVDVNEPSLSSKIEPVPFFEEVTADNINGVLPIKSGGTGATDVETARSNLGLGTAASRQVGIENGQIPDVNLTKKASGRVFSPVLWSGYNFNNINAGDYYFYDTSVVGVSNPPPFSYGTVFAQRNYRNDDQLTVIGHDYFNGGVVTRGKQNNNWSAWAKHWHTLNTTVDGNGFIKKASPIAQLFADKIELNDEAEEQDITFEKLGVGDYIVKGSTGLAQEGWYIEMPKDANGNVLVAVVYEQLDNNDISVKTYDYMLNKKGRIVPDLETPLDIPETRWIDLRLNELPKGEL